VSSGGNQPRFEDLKKFFVARARWHRHIQNFAGSRSFACLRGRTAAWIGTVMMRAEIKNGTVVIEGVLGAVTVVVIPIDDQHATDAMLRLQIPGCDGDVIEDAEASLPEKAWSTLAQTG